MKKHYNDSTKDAARAVTVGAVVMIWVDPRAASHARGVMAIVFAAKETGGILACSDGGVIVNGITKKEWWIAADGYALKVMHDEMVVLSPNLAEVQKQILAGTFSAKQHPGLGSVALEIAQFYRVLCSDPKLGSYKSNLCLSCLVNLGTDAIQFLGWVPISIFWELMPFSSVHTLDSHKIIVLVPIGDFQQWVREVQS